MLNTKMNLNTFTTTNLAFAQATKVNTYFLMEEKKKLEKDLVVER